MLHQYLKTLPQFLLQITTLTIICVYIWFNYSQSPFNSDFRSFHSATQILISKPNNLYNASTQFHQQQLHLNPGYEFLPFINPPFYLLPYLPFINIPTLTTYSLMRLCIVSIIGLNLYLLFKIFRPTAPLNTILISLSFASTYSTVINTQNAAISLLLFIVIYLNLTHKKYLSVGIILSLLTYKPQLLLIILPYLVIKYPRPILTGFIIGNIILFLINYYLYPYPTTYYQYLYQYANLHDGQITTNLKYISLTGLLAQTSTYLIPIPFKAIATIFNLITIIYTLKYLLQHPLSLPHQFSLIIIATLLTASHVNHPDALLLLFPFIYFFTTPTFKISLTITTGWLIFLISLFVPSAPHYVPFIAPLFLVAIYYLLTRYDTSTH